MNITNRRTNQEREIRHRLLYGTKSPAQRQYKFNRFRNQTSPGLSAYMTKQEGPFGEFFKNRIFPVMIVMGAITSIRLIFGRKIGR